MSSSTEASEKRAVLLTMAACVVVAVAAVVVALVFTGPDEPGKGKKLELSVAEATTSSCTLTTGEDLKDATFAFEGTLVELDGDQAVFEVDHWYKGEEAEEVEVEAEGARLHDVPLVEDTRYLVAGEGEDIGPCGTAEATLDLRAAYEKAFGKED